MKKNYHLLLLLISPAITFADTMDHYMGIVNNIPQMEMKADPQSQAWARSARNILSLTGECIAESLIIANKQALAKGQPLFCLPQGTSLDAKKLNEIIQSTYNNKANYTQDKNKQTVSEVALLALERQFPCQQQQANVLFNSSNLFAKNEPTTSTSGYYQQANSMKHDERK